MAAAAAGARPRDAASGRGGPAARGGLPCLRTPAEPPPPPPPPAGCPRGSFTRRRCAWGFFLSFFLRAGGLEAGSGLPSPESRLAPRVARGFL